jgi:hypothetical protein
MKRILLFAGLLLVIAIAGGIAWWYNTKSYSPENSLVFEDGDLKITVFYNRPYKKGRVIFGGLVPFGKTWRTGANEPTVFETNKDLFLNGKKLPRGKYSLWTVPDEERWQIIFNTTIPPWGIDVMKDGQAARDQGATEYIIDVPVVESSKEIEQFTITVEKAADAMELVFLWDRTLVAVPLSLSEQ